MRASTALSVVLLAVVAPSLGGEEPEDVVLRKSESSGIELLVRARKEVPAGGPYFVSFRIHNRGKYHVGVDESGYHRVFDITVIDADGAKVPMTRFGIKRLTGAPGRGRTYHLKAGGTYTRLFNLARLFDLSLAGKYRVTIRKTVYAKGDPRKGKVPLEIKELPLSVREPSGEDHKKWDHAKWTEGR